jgi:hypothetical protein
MQNASAPKVAAATNERYLGSKRQGLASPQFDRGVWTHDPLLIVSVKIDWDATERAAPFHHRRVEMRMRYRNRFQAAEPFDQRDGGRIQHRNAVPQNVSVRGTDNECPLADGKGRLRPNTNHAGLVLTV